MNSIADMGGVDGYGPVFRAISREAAGSAFAEPGEDWEIRCAALLPAAGATVHYPVDEQRHSIESCPPAYYLTTSYYEHWLCFYEETLVRRGILTVREIEERIRQLRDNPNRPNKSPATPRPDIVRANNAEHAFWLGQEFKRPRVHPAKFKVGDRVRTRNHQPLGHTRLPGYLREKVGMIIMTHGVFVFPDTNAMGLGEKPQDLYTVEFATSEVWGERADKAQSLHATLWDDYLDPAGASDAP